MILARKDIKYLGVSSRCRGLAEHSRIGAAHQSHRFPTPMHTNCETNPSGSGKADCMPSVLVRSCLAASVIPAVFLLLCSGCASHSKNPPPRQSVQIVS